MKRTITGIVAVGVAAAFLSGADPVPDNSVEIAQLNDRNWDELAPTGKEVDAIYGDYVLRNQFLTAVIAQPKGGRNANMTVRTVGGALIDLTTRSQPSDQLSAYYPGRRRYSYRAATVEGDDGEVSLADGVIVQASRGAVTVASAGGSDLPAVQVTYELLKDARWLSIHTRYTNESEKELEVSLEDDIRADGGQEWMGKAPNGQDQLFWLQDRFWRQAYGVFVEKGSLQFNSDARNTVLKYNQDGATSIKLKPGKSYSWTRKVFPADNLMNVRAVAGELNGQSSSELRVMIKDALGRPVADASVEIRSGRDTVGESRTDSRGTFQCLLPPGAYTARIRHLGNVIPPSLPFKVEDRDDVRELSFDLKYRPGRVNVAVTDESGDPIPCKLDFEPLEGSSAVVFGPDSADSGVKNLYYAHDGRCSQAMPAGRYDLLISRGPEFDTVSRTVTIPEGGAVDVSATLVRSVETPGWISTDFHSHSSPSGDNTGSQRGRVLNLVCEHVEFAPCTEHNRVSTYDGHIEELGIERFIGTVSGMELTGSPLPLNHQNVFPMVHRPHTQDGGGPVTDSSPERQVERIASWDGHSEKLIQQNHPDIGWLFFDKNGDQKPDEGYERSFSMIDVMEIHPIQSALFLGPVESNGRRGHNRVFNWLQLLNQGYRIFGVVNTDAHYNFHGSSSVRNWVQSPTDQPSKIQPMDVVYASEEGHLVMSNGPYLEVSLRSEGVSKPVGPGHDVLIRGGKATLSVRVQCANWLDIDRVLVLVNGRLDPQHQFTRESNPAMFSDETVKFDEKIQLDLKSDAHVVVIAGHAGMKLGRVVGPNWGRAEPAAIANPIFIDTDGNGFTPNGDTLDHPLPVKFVAGK